MQRYLYGQLERTEAAYWWFVGQRFLLSRFLRKQYGAQRSLKLLDVGCGTGKNLEVLRQWGTAVGADISSDAIEFCRRRGFTIRKSDVMSLKFPDNAFDVVTSLGVFYHRNVTDDVRGFREIHRVLKPSGRFFFLDCATKALYGKHDLAFDGIRRYERKELKAKLESAGFAVEKISYINTLLFPAIFLYRKLDGLRSTRPESNVQEKISPLLNALLTFLYKTELRGVSYVSYPFGVNIFAVARKRQN